MNQPLISINLTPNTVHLLVEGLSELPYKRVASTIEQLAAAHNNAVNPKPPEKKKRAQAKPAAQE